MRLLFFGLLFFTSGILFGQIKTTKIFEEVPTSFHLPYDSLNNFEGENIKKYIGQVLYLNQKPLELRQYGYADMFEYYKENEYKEKVYKCCESYNTIYKEVAGKYFLVIDAFKHPKSTENERLYGKSYILKLVEKETNDTLIYHYNSEYKTSFPFIILGYFEKLKKTNVGHEFIFQNKLIDGSINIETGKIIKIKTGTIWTCIDVTIEDKYYYLSLVFKNINNEKIAIEYDILSQDFISTTYFTTLKANYYQKKFGNENWKNILEGKAKIGMTREMCKISWGIPKKINETITLGKKREQWVYDDNYLYFFNGTLTTIQ